MSFDGTGAVRYAHVADMVRASLNTRWWLSTAALLGLTGALQAQVLPGRGRPIEFSEPRSHVAATNISEMNADKTSLRKLDDEFKKPFELFGFGESPAARLTTPPPVRVLPAPPPSRSLRELLQKRDQWLELETEEGEGLGLTAEEMLRVPKYGADGQPLKRGTQIERYYEDLDRARAAAQAAVTNRAARESLNARFFGEEEEVKPLNLKLFEEPVNPFAQETAERNKPSTPGNGQAGFGDLIAPRNQPRDFSEVFGFGNVSAPPGAVQDADAFQSRKRNIEDLLTLRFMNSPAGGANGASSVGGAPAPLTQNPLGRGASAPPVAPGFGGGAGGAGAAGTGGGFNPAAPLASGVPSLAGPPALLGAPQPAWGAPLPESPRPKLAPAPFQIPQRKF